METLPPSGPGGDPDAHGRRPREATKAGELLRRSLARRRQRRGPDAPRDAYDAALEKGLAGEELVGADLEHRLAGTECVIVNSLRFLGRGDIDHLVIGPGGITVIDAKNWTGPVTVRGLVPRVERWSKPEEVRKLQRQLAGVRLALLHARPELRNTGVRGVMCLAAEPRRSATELQDGLVLGGSAAAAEIAARPGTLSTGAIAHLREVLVTHLPDVTADAIDELQEPLSRQLSDRSPATHAPAAEDSHGHGRSRPLGRRAARSGRSRRRGTRLDSLLFTILAATIAWWGIAHLRFVLPGPAGTISQLTVARRSHHLVVRYTATAGATVRLRIRGLGRVRQADRRAEGRQQTWIGPRITHASRPIRVQACVIQSTGRCGPLLTRVSTSGHHGRSVHAAGS